MKANQSGLQSPSLTQLNVRDSRRRLPTDLIIFLISRDFKGKRVHLACEQTCQRWTRETVPRSVLSAETNARSSPLPGRKCIFRYLFIHVPNRQQFKQEFLVVAAFFYLSFSAVRRVFSATSCHSCSTSLLCPHVCGGNFSCSAILGCWSEHPALILDSLHPEGKKTNKNNTPAKWINTKVSPMCEHHGRWVN